MGFSFSTPTAFRKTFSGSWTKGKELVMDTVDVSVTALTAPNQFVETRGRRLAYRSIGSGTPIVLCTRFRGNMDLWA